MKRQDIISMIHKKIDMPKTWDIAEILGKMIEAFELGHNYGWVLEQEEEETDNENTKS